MSNGEVKTAPKNKKRMGYFKMRNEVELTTQVGLEVRAYDEDGCFVGRLEINRAGIEPFVRKKGTTSLGNLSWEKVFKRLAKRK